MHIRAPAHGDLANDITAGIPPRDAFYGIQNFLFAAANISKALWGRDPDNRKDLRTSLGVADMSPLKTVRMRDHYAHFDERLERWWNTSTSRFFVDVNFMPVKAIRNKLGETSTVMRNFDPTTGELVFWGDDFNIVTIANEIMQILDRANEVTSKPAPWIAQPTDSE